MKGWNRGTTVGLCLVVGQVIALAVLEGLYRYERLERNWELGIMAAVLLAGWPAAHYAYRRGFRDASSRPQGTPQAGEARTAPAPPPAEPKPAKPPKPARSEALTLLAALQREARFVDFVQEPIDAYDDAQIGAAVREVHRHCAAVLTRIFALKQVVPQDEGSAVEVPQDFDAARFRLTGNVVGQPPYLGRLVHHGWEATKCDLPAWSGSPDSARVVVPAEVEVQ